MADIGNISASIRMDFGVWAALREYSRKTGHKIGWLVGEAIRRYLPSDAFPAEKKAEPTPAVTQAPTLAADNPKPEAPCKSDTN